MGATHNRPESSSPVHVVEHLKDLRTKRVATASASSQTLATLFGSALNADVAAVTIINRGSDALHHNPVGTAAATNAALKEDESYTIYGDKALLDTVEVYRSSAQNVDLIEHGVR